MKVDAASMIPENDRISDLTSPASEKSVSVTREQRAMVEQAEVVILMVLMVILFGTPMLYAFSTSEDGLMIHRGLRLATRIAKVELILLYVFIHSADSQPLGAFCFLLWFESLLPRINFVQFYHS